MVTAWTFTIPGPPVPKARPRVIAGHTHTPKRTRVFEQLVHQLAMMAGVRAGAGPVSVTVAAFFPDRRQIDLDNCLKAVVDGLVGAPVLSGDHWAAVPRMSISGALDAANPRTVVTVEVVE